MAGKEVKPNILSTEIYKLPEADGHSNEFQLDSTGTMKTRKKHIF